ncbi:MAG: DUF3991 and TOPRIM domain-containing protein [Oscillospiraceae bacterium]|nr:DUF3991 and TOPRIM domain-containing protein [Oscillospiraceae bacterium]
MKRLDLDKIKSEIRITDYAQRIGYTLTKVGSYYSLAEHDSVRIDDKKNCFWRNSQFAQGQKANTAAGSIIDFVMHFEGKDFKNALETLGGYYEGDFTPSEPTPTAKSEKPTVPFALPPKNTSNSAVINYLVNVRGIDKDIVSEYIIRRTIYQDKRNNAVFVGYNADGKADFACLRGTYSEKRFVKDIEGCNYDNCIFLNNGSNTLVVTESIIDSLSYMSILKARGINHDDYNYNALSGTGKIAAVLNNLKAHNNINAVIIALDNDEGGINAGDRLETMLREAGWQGRILKHYSKHKDWNEELLHSKQSLSERISSAEAAKDGEAHDGASRDGRDIENER